MSTTHHQVVGKCNDAAACEFKDENTFRRETLFFRVKWFPCSRVWGSVCKSCRQKARRTVARARFALQKVYKKNRRRRRTFRRWGWQKVHRTVAGARFALQNVKKLTASEHFWKMRSATCARDCSESSVSHKNCKKTGTFRAAPKSPHGRSSYAGLQLAVTKHIGRAACSKAWVMLRRSWQAGLQLDAAKRSVTAAQTSGTSDAFHSKIRNDGSEQVCYSCRFAKVTWAPRGIPV